MQTHVLTCVSIIVPTYNEEANVWPLVQCVKQVLGEQPTEMLFVDDSPTLGTVEAIQSAGRHLNSPTFQVRCYRREGEACWGGLAGAVIDGFKRARSALVVVMDGDLQHPPEVIPLLLKEAAGGTQLVVASRYCAGGSAEGLSGPARRLVSRSSTWLAKICFPIALRHITDPMTGFFAVRLNAIDLEGLQPRGFKILLEILARNPGLGVSEVPFKFVERVAGQSKGTMMQGLQYLLHLVRLRLSTMGHSLSGIAQTGKAALRVESS
jgi:dolichol-phosphate mannosyltransferase